MRDILAWNRGAVFFLLALFVLTSGCQEENSPDPVTVQGKDRYEVRLHIGVPTLFIDGAPSFYGAGWSPAPTVDACLFNDRVLGANSYEIRVELEPASTSLFYTGNKTLLSRYEALSYRGSVKGRR